MKLNLIAFFIVLCYSAQSQNVDYYKNTISIYRLLNSDDSLLTKDNFYIAGDSTGFLEYINHPFRENSYYHDYQSLKEDSIVTFERYDPTISTSPPFRFSKKGSSIFLHFKIKDKDIESLYINLRAKKNIVRTGFLGNPTSVTFNASMDTIVFDGEEKLRFGGKTVSCYKISDQFCTSSDCFQTTIYLQKNNLNIMRYERKVYMKGQPEKMSENNIYILAAIMHMDYQAMKGLHIWGRRKL